MKELELFPKILKELRLQNNFTQKYIASKLFIAYQSYQAYELGVSIPTLENFIKLAKFFDVSLDYLIGKDI